MATLALAKLSSVREIIRSLSTKDTIVSSPTYNIVQEYTGRACHIYHFDLYRLNHPDELLEIGIEDAMNLGITLIEWPEIAKNMLPKNIISIKLEAHSNVSSDSMTRLCTINIGS